MEVAKHYVAKGSSPMARMLHYLNKNSGGIPLCARNCRPLPQIAQNIAQKWCVFRLSEINYLLDCFSSYSKALQLQFYFLFGNEDQVFNRALFFKNASVAPLSCKDNFTF